MSIVDDYLKGVADIQRRTKIKPKVGRKGSRTSTPGSTNDARAAVAANIAKRKAAAAAYKFDAKHSAKQEATTKIIGRASGFRGTYAQAERLAEHGPSNAARGKGPPGTHASPASIAREKAAKAKPKVKTTTKVSRTKAAPKKTVSAPKRKKTYPDNAFPTQKQYAKNKARVTARYKSAKASGNTKKAKNTLSRLRKNFEKGDT